MQKVSSGLAQFGTIRHGVASGAVALAACTLVSVGLLGWVSATAAESSEAGDVIGLFTIYAVASSVPAVIGILYSAVIWAGLHYLWAALLGPIASIIGFLSRDVAAIVADIAGLSRPGISSVLCAALVSFVASFLVYFIAWKVRAQVLAGRPER